VKKLTSPSVLFLLGAFSSAPLFGIYMYFGPLVLLVSPIYFLNKFFNADEPSLKKIRQTASFIFGALCGWLAIYFLFVKGK